MEETAGIIRQINPSRKKIKRYECASTKRQDGRTRRRQPVHLAVVKVRLLLGLVLHALDIARLLVEQGLLLLAVYRLFVLLGQVAGLATAGAEAVGAAVALEVVLGTHVAAVDPGENAGETEAGGGAESPALGGNVSKVEREDGGGGRRTGALQLPPAAPLFLAACRTLPYNMQGHHHDRQPVEVVSGVARREEAGKRRTCSQRAAAGGSGMVPFFFHDGGHDGGLGRGNWCFGDCDPGGDGMANGDCVVDG